MKKLYAFFALSMLTIGAMAQPDNDQPCNAQALTVDGGPAIYSNVDATVDANEAEPPQGPCETAWCDGMAPEVTMWFTFTAPSNGAVVISTCLASTAIDAQVALWTADNCLDYSSYGFVAANDDAIDGCSEGNQYASVLSVDGLNAGSTYYIQVDGFGGETGDVEIEVMTGVPTSRVNIIHNSADLALTQVDVRINGELVADDMEFQTCTGYLELTAGVEHYVTINDAASDDDSSPLYSTNLNLDSSKDYVVIATGIYSESGYTPAPELTLAVHEAQLGSSGFGQWALLLFGGSTDQQTVDLENMANGITWVDNLAYGTFNATGYIEFAGGNYSVDMTDADGNSISPYCIQLPIFGAPAFTLVSSGFVNPADNSNGAPFGWYLVNHFNGDFIPILEGECPIPANDHPCDAVELIVDAPPVSFDNTFASADPGEVTPPNLPFNDPEVDCYNSWCDGEPVSNTLWFKFIAPSTGSVGITTCFANSFDTQLAVWTVPNSCDDYSTFGFHQNNDDAEPICGDGDQYASAFQVFYLTPGNMHWVQLDGWGGITGTFDIAILTMTSVDENQAIPFSYYPNPATDLLYLDCSINGAQATITDMSGRTVKTMQLNGRIQYDVSDIAPGIYTLTVSDSGMASSGRLVIE